MLRPPPMLAIQCTCGQTNDAAVERCVNCGAAVSVTPPTSGSRARGATYFAGMLFVVGLVWLFVLPVSAGDTPPRSWRDAEFLPTIYWLFGVWPPVVAWWIGSGLFLLHAWRLRRAMRSEAAQSHSVVVASQTTASSAPLSGSAARLYWPLAALVAGIAALCLLTTLVGIVPILSPDPFSNQLAYGWSGLAAALVIAGVVLRTRVPRRPFTQSTMEYWSSAPVASATTPMWLTLESAVMAAGVGYFLIGDPVSALALCAAIAGFAWCNPRACARQ